MMIMQWRIWSYDLAFVGLGTAVGRTRPLRSAVRHPDHRPGTGTTRSEPIVGGIRLRPRFAGKRIDHAHDRPKGRTAVRRTPGSNSSSPPRTKAKSRGIDGGFDQVADELSPLQRLLKKDLGARNATLCCAI